MVKYSTQIMKGDWAEWKYAEVDGILFECFPLRNEYLVAGTSISVFDKNYILKGAEIIEKHVVCERIWNSEKTLKWEEYDSRDEAFERAGVLVKEFRKNRKEKTNG